MRPDPVAESRRWFQQARWDLSAAQLLADNGYFNLACFHSQQSAEKALKAFLILQGARDIHGHAVAQLCDDASGFDPAFRALRRRGALLDKHYIPTRYPNGLPGGLPAEAYGPEDARSAAEIAEEILRAVGQRLAEGASED